MISKKAEKILDLMFPRRCPVCDDVVDRVGSLVCDECRDVFARVREPYCLKCGRPLKDDGKTACPGCAGSHHAFIRGRAALSYDDELKESVYRFKYGGRREYADHYVMLMLDELGDFIGSCGAQALVPIPLHKARLKKRGYNQAELLAQGISRATGIPVINDLLRREEETVVQKSLDARHRQNNLKKAFKIASDVVKLKNIILIDDIYTTGSTIDKASECLQKAGVSNIYFTVLGIADNG